MDSLASFEKRFHLGTSECDINGQWMLRSLLEMAQNTANEHSAALHLWHDDLIEQDLSWVLFKTDLYVDRYPRLGECVTVRTFTKGARSMFCPRYYLVTDARGALIARIGSLLMLMDRTTRKAVSPAERGIVLPDAEEEVPPVKISMGVKSLSGEEKRFRYQPQYADIDINGHVNNVRYADWLCNRLGIEIMRQYEISFAAIDYRHEVVPEIPMEMILTRSDDAFQFSGNAEDRQLFSIYGQLRARSVH